MLLGSALLLPVKCLTALPSSPQPAAGKKGGAAPRGFTDHNAKWLKPKQRQQEPSSEEEEGEEAQGLSDEELSLSGEEFSDDDDGPLGSDGAPLWQRVAGGCLAVHHPGWLCSGSGAIVALGGACPVAS